MRNSVLMVACLLGTSGVSAAWFSDRSSVDSPAQQVSVLDFGAIPDDAGDDSAAIQRALDQGGRIDIPKGRYIVSTLVLTGSGVTITGEGMLQKRRGVNGVLLNVTGNDNVIKEIRLDSRADGTIRGAENDTLRIEGDRNRVEQIGVIGSNGNGIRINGGARNKIIRNRVEHVQQNSILVSNAGADMNVIADNTLIQTTAQNNIFVTADDGSRPSDAHVSSNLIIGNECRDAFDTGIESGQNADNTLIVDNRISGSRNPAILLRDGRNVVVRSNIIETTSSSRFVAEQDGIAVVPLFRPTSWSYSALIEKNRIDGPIVRSGIYVGGSGVRIVDNEIIGRSATSGYGITLAGAVSDLEIKNNRIRNVERGIDLNFDGRPQSHFKIKIFENHISNAKSKINTYNVHLKDSMLQNF